MKSKVTALLAALLCTCHFTNAQTIEKGSTLIGGGFSFGSTKYRTQNSFSSDSLRSKGGNTTLSFGKAVKNNSILGVVLTYGGTKAESLKTNGFKTTGSLYSASVFYRHFIELGNKFYFWAQPSAGFNFGETRTTNSGTDYTKSMGGGLFLTPGLAYNVYKSLYMDLSLNNIASLSYNANTSPGSEQKGFGFNSSLSGGTIENVGIGFNLIF